MTNPLDEIDAASKARDTSDPRPTFAEAMQDDYRNDWHPLKAAMLERHGIPVPPAPGVDPVLDARLADVRAFFSENRVYDEEADA